jgi:ankyrin repeat protein
MPLPLEYGKPIPLIKQRRFRRRALLVFCALAFLAGSWFSIPRFLEYRHNRQLRLDDELVAAAELGDRAKIINLINRGARLTPSRTSGWTALQYAVKRGDRPLVELLLSKGADINSGAYPPLVHAITNNDLDMAEYLFSKGADVNKPAGRDSLLHAAIHSHVIPSVRWLISKKADVNMRGQYGGRPLHEAVAFNDKEAVDLLLAAGALPDATNDEGTTPLDFAAWRNEQSIAAPLIGHGAKPTVWSATAFGDLQQVKKFVSANPSLVHATFGTHDEKARSLLYLAARNAREEVFAFLLEQGADAKAMNSRGETILHAAAGGGSCKIIETLLFRGLNVNVKTLSGETPLHETAMCGRLQAATLLLDRGAEIDDASGEITPFDWAVCYGHSDVADLLLKRGAKMPPTILHDAITYADLDMVKFLIERKAQINAVDNKGWTPLHVAMDWGKKPIADYLVAHGADVNARDKNGKTPHDVGANDEIGE